MPNREIKSLANIGAMDNGVIDAVFRKAICAAIADMIDRPAVKASRRIVVKIEMKPEQDQNGALAAVGFDVEIENRQPTQKTRQFKAGIIAGGDGLTYAELSASDPNQHTMTFDEKETKTDEE